MCAIVPCIVYCVELIIVQAYTLWKFALISSLFYTEMISSKKSFGDMWFFEMSYKNRLQKNSNFENSKSALYMKS